MSDTTDLGSVDRKVEWAKRQARELVERMHVIGDNDAFVVDTIPDPDNAGFYAQYLRINEPAATDMNNEIALRVGDIVHNLRSALDHLAVRAVEAVQPNPPHMKDIAFPIPRGENPAADYKSLVLGKVKGAADPVIKHFLSLEPWYGGKDEGLRILDAINILDKHQFTVGIFPVTDQLTLNAGALVREAFPDIEVPEIFFGIRPPVHGPLKDGDKLLGNVAMAGFEGAPLPRIQTAFAGPEAIKGEEVARTLAELGGYAESVIDSFRPLF